jgi:hypothetical protein
VPVIEAPYSSVGFLDDVEVKLVIGAPTIKFHVLPVGSPHL